MSRQIFLCLTVLIFPFSSTFCQLDKVYGEVRDVNGKGIEGVSINLLHHDLPIIKTIALGKFELDLSNSKKKVYADSLLEFEISKDGYVSEDLNKVYTSRTDTYGELTDSPFILFEEKLSTVSGRLMSPNGQPLENYIVELRDFRTVLPRDTTDRNGDFKFDVSGDKITIKVGQAVQLDFFDFESGDALNSTTKSPNGYGDLFNIVYATYTPGLIVVDNLPTNSIIEQAVIDINGQQRLIYPAYLDADLDGRLNDVDRCPCEFGVTRGGCPFDVKRIAFKPFPGFYDKEWIILTGWGASLFMGITSLYKIQDFKDKRNNATTGNKYKMYDDKINTWETIGIISASGIAITYILDNLNLTRDTDCLTISSTPENIGLLFSYNF